MAEISGFWAGEITKGLEKLEKCVSKIETKLDNHLKHHQNLELKRQDMMFKIIITIITSAILVIQIIT